MAFRRSAMIDASSLPVSIEGETVVLEGEVSSATERAQAQLAAKDTSGVAVVDNRIIVVPPIARGFSRERRRSP